MARSPSLGTSPPASFTAARYSFSDDEGRDLGEVLLAAGADGAGRGLDDQQLALAAEQRDLALPARIDAPRRGGEFDVGRELGVVLDEQRLVGGDELLDEGAVDDLEVRHHPAAILEHPVGADADELPLARQVGIEGEAAAGDGAVVALAVPRALAMDRHAVAGELGHDLLGGIVIGLELRPQVGARPEQVELDLVDHRHGVLGRAAHRLAAVQRRAFAAAIEARHRGVEAFVERGEVGGLDGCLGHEAAVYPNPI